MSITPCTTHDMTANVTESMCVQEIAAPGTPPPQARMSRFGAAQAGKQGTGQSSAAQHGDQPPTGPNDSMQEANPYRSLGQPELFYKHTTFFDLQLNIGSFRTVSILCREVEARSKSCCASVSCCEPYAPTIVWADALQKWVEAPCFSRYSRGWFLLV